MAVQAKCRGCAFQKAGGVTAMRAVALIALALGKWRMSRSRLLHNCGMAIGTQRSVWTFEQMASFCRMGIMAATALPCGDRLMLKKVASEIFFQRLMTLKTQCAAFFY